MANIRPRVKAKPLFLERKRVSPRESQKRVRSNVKDILELFKKGALPGQIRDDILRELKDLIAKQHNLERTIGFDTAELLLVEEKLRLSVKNGRKVKIPELTKSLEKAEAIFEAFKKDYIQLKVLLDKLGLSNVQSLKFMSDVLIRYNLPDILKTLLLRLIKSNVYPEV